MSMTPAEQAAWDAIGRDQTKWAAVKKALKAAAPIIRDRAALNIASILDDYGMAEAAAEVRAMPAAEAAIRAELTR
jgi:hypothetical protein